METDEKATGNGRISLEGFMECSNDNVEACIKRNEYDMQGAQVLIIMVLFIMAFVIIIPMASGSMRQY